MMVKMRKPILYILIFIASLLIMEGCLVGPNYQKSTPDQLSLTQEGFRYDSLEMAETDSALNLKWWELFNDPELNKLITIGLRENKDARIATSRIDQSRAMVGITKADYWPQISYSFEAQQSNTLAGIPIEGGASTSVVGGFGSLNWELDFWGKFRRSNEAARSELVASEYGLRAIQIGLISQITGTYFLLLDYRWRLDISRHTLQLRHESLEIIQARFDEGIIPEIDLNQAQIQHAIAAASVPLFERNVAQTENALGILLGRNPGPLTIGSALFNQEFPPDIPPGLPSTLLMRRPDIVRAEELSHAQTARIGIAQAQRFPSISLTGLLGVASTDLSAFTSSGAAWTGGTAWNAGASLLGPLLNFGKNKRRVEIETYKAEQAVLEYEKTVITAFQEVEDALVELETFKDEIQARQDHVAAALNARNLSKERYDKGVTSFLELLESERQAFEAELSLSQTTQQLFNSYAKLYKALGGGWISIEEMNIANNPPPQN
jgi:outer membrane protein, multidrug efflux system